MAIVFSQIFYDQGQWDNLMILIGEITIIIILALLLSSLIIAIITVLSIRRQKLYFPRLMQSGFVLIRGLIGSMCKLFGLEDRELITFTIRMHNMMEISDFESVPPDERAIFLPHCLRSAECPGRLSPEGIKCINCGKCPVGPAVVNLKRMGYHVFIIPGSTYIKRMMKLYRPKAIIGVGCLYEVREGIEMSELTKTPVIGVINITDGCVETMANWSEIYDVAIRGVDPSLIPGDLDGLAN